MVSDPPTPLLDFPELEAVLVAEQAQAAAAPSGAPLFDAGTIAAAVVDGAGRVICASPAFEAIHGAAHIDAERVARALRGAPPATVAVDLAGETGPEPAIFAYGFAGDAGAWRLPPEVRAAAEARPDRVVVLTARLAQAGRPLEAACRAYGLSSLQTRVVLETIRTGGVKTAAVAAGVAYSTARQVMGEAMQKVRAPRLAALVSNLTTLALGVLPNDDSPAVLENLWGLTRRQAAVAVLAGGGASRASAARALGVSEAVVRKELERVHLVLQVSTGAELARRVVEARALRWLTDATGGDLGFVEEGLEPLGFVHRPDGRRIAISDYGPSSGRPVLVVHSTTTSRIVARRLLRALWTEGYRPISIDRPGFGLTDEVEGAAAGAHDPFEMAALDTLTVLDRLKLRQVDVVARGGAQVVMAFARLAPDRLGRVVLVNPDPPIRGGGQAEGGSANAKAAFMRNPATVALLARWLTRAPTYESVVARLRHGARRSPPDALAMQDPEIARDYFRALRPFATGRHAGWINEVQAFMGASPPPVAGTRTWSILIGQHDFLHDPETVVAVWPKLLPDARMRVVADTGRYMALSHPQVVVDELKGS